MLTVTIITLVSVYLSLVVGTIIKFDNNGIHLSLLPKILLIFLPLVLFILHIKMAIENLHKNKKMSLEIIKMATIQYPLALGILIEVMLEKSAQRAVFGSDKMKHRKSGSPIEINAKVITKQKGFINIYQKTVRYAH